MASNTHWENDNVSDRTLLRTAPWAGLLISLAVTGCKPATGEVSGKVLFQGQPLTSGTVLIFCQNQQIISGIIGSQGDYKIAKVPLGSARVTVRTHPPVPIGFHLQQKLPPSQNAPEFRAPKADGRRYVPIPEKYNIPEESGLKLTVDQASQEFNIHLTP